VDALELGSSFALLSMAVVGIAEDRVTAEVKDATYRAYRILLHGILALCALFFIAGDRISWTNCLAGFAWRGWLLRYCLPAWLAAFRADPVPTRTAGPRPG
jgi:hypothetical protein